MRAFPHLFNVKAGVSDNTVELGYNVMKGTEYLCRYKRVLL
jgi:hypothetical protein